MARQYRNERTSYAAEFEINGIITNMVVRAVLCVAMDTVGTIVSALCHVKAGARLANFEGIQGHVESEARYVSNPNAKFSSRFPKPHPSPINQFGRDYSNKYDILKCMRHCFSHP